MIADSIKFKDYRCFKDEWAGFEEFKPINVIIGRNNTGKSHLLDLVKRLTEQSPRESELTLQASGILDEASLKQKFPEGGHGGDLGQNHWLAHGKQFRDKRIKWEVRRGHFKLLEVPENPNLATDIKVAREKRISDVAYGAVSPFHKKVFRRILADRDIQPEKVSGEMAIEPDGRGATQVVHRFILSEHLNEDLIQIELLKALQDIFGSDGDFHRVEIRETGATHAPSADSKYEIFLGEPNKGLVPLRQSGSGLKTIILMLLNLIVMPTVLKPDGNKSDFVFAFEELENNLHPALLRRLFRYLADYVSREKCMLFLTTHSNVAVDFFGSRDDAQIIQVMHDKKSATTRTVKAHFDRVSLLSELGARPSDLLQANGVLWLEGPSDRIFLNRFLELFSKGELLEGRDYQCAFYGGSNLANTEFCAPEDSNRELTNLLRLNSNIAVICDSDLTKKTGKGSDLKDRVQRISEEVAKIPKSLLWITKPKEIENYIPGSVWAKVFDKKSVPDPTLTDMFPSNPKAGCFVFDHCGRRSFDKVEFATKASPLLTKDDMSTRFDFTLKMQALVDKIREWNQ